MKVRCVRSFAALVGKKRYTISEGASFTLPDGVDWIKAGLVVPVETATAEPVENAARPKRTRRKKS